MCCPGTSRAAQQGDPVATAIFCQAGDALATVADALRRHAVVWRRIGSGEFLRAPFFAAPESRRPAFEPQVPLHPPHWALRRMRCAGDTAKAGLRGMQPAWPTSRDRHLSVRRDPRPVSA